MLITCPITCYLWILSAFATTGRSRRFCVSRESIRRFDWRPSQKKTQSPHGRWFGIKCAWQRQGAVLCVFWAAEYIVNGEIRVQVIVNGNAVSDDLLYMRFSYPSLRWRLLVSDKFAWNCKHKILIWWRSPYDISWKWNAWRVQKKDWPLWALQLDLGSAPICKEIMLFWNAKTFPGFRRSLKTIFGFTSKNSK